MRVLVMALVVVAALVINIDAAYAGAVEKHVYLVGEATTSDGKAVPDAWYRHRAPRPEVHLCVHRGREKTVNAHLEQQLAFLQQSDLEVLAAVQSIQKDEESHEAYASAHGGQASGVYAILWWSVAGATSFAIWLSTHL